MVDYEVYILKALQKAVTVAVGQQMPVKYMNTNINPPSDGKWWEVVYIPNNVTNEFWSEGKTYQGVLRLILHWPQDNKGAYDAMTEVSRVANSFQKGNVFTDPSNLVQVRIQDHANANGVIEEPPSLILPLTIRYSCSRIS